MGGRKGAGGSNTSDDRQELRGGERRRRFNKASLAVVALRCPLCYHG